MCGYETSGPHTWTPRQLDERLYDWLDQFFAVGDDNNITDFMAKIAARTGWPMPKQELAVHSQAKAHNIGHTLEPTLDDVSGVVRDNEADFRLYFRFHRLDSMRKHFHFFPNNQ